MLMINLHFSVDKEQCSLIFDMYFAQLCFGHMFAPVARDLKDDKEPQGDKWCLQSMAISSLCIQFLYHNQLYHS